MSDLEKQEKDEMEFLRKLLDDIIDMRLSNYDYSDEGKSKSSSSFVRTHFDPSFLKYSQGSRETTSISYSDFSSFKDTVTLDSSSEIEETESKGSRLPLDSLLSSHIGMHSHQVEAGIIPKTKQKKDTQSSFGKADIPITPQADDLPVKVENLVTEDLDEPRSSFETLKVSTVPQLKSLSSNLHSLKIEGCESLEALPDDLLGGITALKELYLISCCSLKSFPYPAASLTTLYMRNCRRLGFLPSSESREKLASVYGIVTIFNQLMLPEFKGDLASLESLEIRDCPRLRFLPDGGLHTPNLESILISNCKNLNALPSGMNFLTSPKTLFLNRCPEIESLPRGGLPSSLIVLSIAYCDKLIPQEDWGLCSLESLRRFELEGGCMGMESFPNEILLPCNINTLRISTLNSLKKLNHKGLQHLNALQTLEIHGCDILRSFFPN
ncbi:Putative disease resistance protein [Arachis hypogaea]|nr:Putative disease resistance protein [Arachis hypogaea]